MEVTACATSKIRAILPKLSRHWRPLPVLRTSKLVCCGSVKQKSVQISRQIFPSINFADGFSKYLVITAFQDLQSKKAETASQVELMDSRISGAMRTMKYSELTLAEISSQKDDTRIYKNIGRAYFLTPKSDLEDFFQSRVKKINENIKGFEDNKMVLTRNLKEAENAIRELVVRKKQKMSENGTS